MEYSFKKSTQLIDLQNIVDPMNCTVGFVVPERVRNNLNSNLKISA